MTDGRQEPGLRAGRLLLRCRDFEFQALSIKLRHSQRSVSDGKPQRKSLWAGVLVQALRALFPFVVVCRAQGFGSRSCFDGAC